MRRHRRHGPLLRRYPLTTEAAAASARAATGDRQGLVVLWLDDAGLVLTAWTDDVTLADVPESCRVLLGVMAHEGPGPAAVVSVDPGFGVGWSGVAAIYVELSSVFSDAGVSLLDWLLVSGEHVVSVAAAVTRNPPS